MGKFLAKDSESAINLTNSIFQIADDARQIESKGLNSGKPIGSIFDQLIAEKGSVVESMQQKAVNKVHKIATHKAVPQFKGP